MTRSSGLIIPWIMVFFLGHIPKIFAGELDDVWGIVTDPLKLRATSQNVSNSIERILQELPHLEEVTNYDMQQRLNQIQAIANEATSGLNGSIDKANSDVASLEKQIDRDAIDFLYRGQCLAANVDDELQKAMAQALKQLKDAQPTVSILHIPVMNFRIKEDGLSTPDEVYRETKRHLIEDLEGIGEKAPANKIYWTYQNLEMLARWTRCRYLDQDGAESFTSEMDEMERLSKPWTRTVNVKLF